MKGEIYIRNAELPKDHLSNVFFQAEEAYVWMEKGNLEAFHIKATCLFRSAELLIAALEAELRKKNAGGTPALPGEVSSSERTAVHEVTK